MKRSQLRTVVLTAILSLAVGAGAAMPATHSSTRATTVRVGSSSLGRILVDGRRHSLYLFEKDRRGHSACSRACATYWPPLLTKTKPSVGRGVKQSLLGVIRRSNGAKQVTYAGHPLYSYVLDTKAGQTTGEGSQDFGAGWDVVSPTGKKIEPAR